jgi:hypothetical protein
MALRSNSELLPTHFPGFVIIAANHAELSGFQNILVSLCSDRSELFARPYDAIDGYRLVAKRALNSADNFRRRKDVVFCRRLQGIFSAFWRILSEHPVDDYVHLGKDLEFVRFLTEAALADPLEPEMHVAFRTGVLLVERLCDIGRVFDKDETSPANAEEGRLTLAVRKYMKQFSIGFAKFYGVAEADWESQELTETQRMLVEAFPIIWPGAIDYMFPLFFRLNPISSHFNSAFVSRVCGFSARRFASFVRDHGILGRLMDCAEVSAFRGRERNEQCRVRAMNPQVWQLARYIATGFLCKSRPIRAIRLRTLPSDCSTEIERFSVFVVKDLLPYIDEWSQGKSRNGCDGVT